MKKLGTLLDKNPFAEEEVNYGLMDILDGSMSDDDSYNDLSYDEEDWLDEFHF